MSPEYTTNGATVDFTSEVDQILLAGIQAGRNGQLEALERVQRMLPSVASYAIDTRMQEIAAAGIPQWLKADEYWTAEMDRVLFHGIHQGQTGERIAVAKVLRLHPELRTAVVWRRLNRLRRVSNRISRSRRRGRYIWTTELDAMLARADRFGGLETVIADIRRLTGFPREAVMRRARRLGVLGERATAPRSWTDADIRFLVESVQHLSVKAIARELDRTEKAVWRKVSGLGLSAKCEEGYTIAEVLRRLHVWHRRLRCWVRKGWIKIGRNRRITERSLRSFLREHPEELKRDLFDAETIEWLLEFGVTRPKEKADAKAIG